MPKIVDLYFYEELSRIAGHETGSQWLLSQCTRLERSSSRKSMTSTGCSSTPCRTPGQSAPASPRAQHLCMETKVPAVHSERHNLSNPESSHRSVSSTSITRLEGVDSSMDQVLRHAWSRLSPSCSFKSDSSLIGLIFTDAAHSVLE
jgi:hypothetical protein